MYPYSSQGVAPNGIYPKDDGASIHSVEIPRNIVQRRASMRVGQPKGFPSPDNFVRDRIGNRHAQHLVGRGVVRQAYENGIPVSEKTDYRSQKIRRTE